MQTQGSGGERLIQMAILSKDKKISNTLEAFSETYCAANGKLCRCTVFSDFEAFASALYPEMYAVVFSDCAGGQEELTLLRDRVPRASIVLVSEDVSVAMIGYTVDASGFLSLPVDYEEFACVFERACRRARREDDKRLIIKGGARYCRVYVKDVRFVEVSGRCLTYHLFDGTITARGQLCGAEKGLEQAGFYRCSANYMVNLRYIESFDRNSVRIGSSEIPVSLRKKRDFYGRLNGSNRRRIP